MLSRLQTATPFDSEKPNGLRAVDKLYSSHVILVANSLPALNAVTAYELPEIGAEVAKVWLSMRSTI